MINIVFLRTFSGVVGLVWSCLDEVFDQFVEDRGDIVESVESLEKPASEGTLEAREGVAAVDDVACASVGIEGFAGGMYGQGIEVVAEDFGAEVLPCSQPGHA